MKKSFDNNEALNEIFGGFKSVEEIENEKKEIKAEPTKEIKRKKTEPEKKVTLFCEVDSVVMEFLDLMTFITGETKKDYINELLKNEIRSTLNVTGEGNDSQIHRAIENKKKELQKLFRKPSM